MMNKQLKQVLEFHKKFKVGINDQPVLLDKDRSDLRQKLMTEEVQEYIDGVNTGDLENIAKELCDIIFVTYGTVIEHGLQDKFDDIFTEVYKSNMTKEYHPEKVQKGPEYKEPDLDKFFPK